MMTRITTVHHIAPDSRSQPVSSELDRPLVSVVVITYNSAPFVLETLESIKCQTYDRVELVISDDASTDETVQICRDWLARNRARFVCTMLVEAESNSGVPGNCNRGVRASTSIWVKLIAGDDLLVDSCIESNLRFAISNGAEFVASNVEEFDESRKRWVWAVPLQFRNISTAFEQWLWLMTGNGILAGSAFFFSREVFERSSGFDERYTLVEDRPFLLSATKSGMLISVLDEITVRHRRHSSSITAPAGTKIHPQLHQVYQCIAWHAKTSGRRLELINARWHLSWFLAIRKTGWRWLNRVRVTLQPIRVRGFRRMLKGNSTR